MSGYDVARITFAAVLIIAAVLKAHQTATDLATQASLGGPVLLKILLVLFELAFAVWLLADFHPQWTRRVAIGLIVAFALVALYKVVAGEASCGCFGGTRIDPRYTLVLDSAFLAALLACRPRCNVLHVCCRRLLLATLTALGISVLTAAMTAPTRPAIAAADGEIPPYPAVVLLEPARWVGRQFPLLNHIDIGERLSKGKWIVVLYDHNCAHCQDAMPRYRQMARDFGGQADAPSLALVELPPFADVTRQ